MTKGSIKKLSTEAEFDVLVAEEDLILEAQMLIQQALNERGLLQKDLADLLGVRPSYVSQMLGLSGRNLTLRTIARALHVLGSTAQIRFRSEVSSDAVREAGDAVAGEVAIDEAPCAQGSEVWGSVVRLAPRSNNRRKGRNEAAAFTDHDPRYLAAA